MEAGKYKVGYWNLGDCITFSILVCGEYGGAIFSLGIGLKVWRFGDFFWAFGCRFDFFWTFGCRFDFFWAFGCRFDLALWCGGDMGAHIRVREYLAF